MDGDPMRGRVREGLRRRSLTLRKASLALGRNAACLHQFLERGSPRTLTCPDGEDANPESDGERNGRWLAETSAVRSVDAVRKGKHNP